VAPERYSEKARVLPPRPARPQQARRSESEPEPEQEPEQESEQEQARQSEPEPEPEQEQEAASETRRWLTEQQLARRPDAQARREDPRH